MLLDVKNLRISYGEVEAVHGVSFSVGEGELVSIIGANGAGKSSILNSVMGLVKSREGSEITYQGTDISKMPPHIRSRKGMRIVPERGRVFSQLTVYENLLTGIYGMRKKIDIPGQLEWIYSLFPVLHDRSRQLATTLSGGEQQQLAIARALISNPRALLVDEISMGLMPILVEKVFQVLKQLNRDYNLTTLIVEQNALASLEISDRGYVLEAGMIVMEGSADKLLKDGGIREAYLGI